MIIDLTEHFSDDIIERMKVAAVKMFSRPERIEVKDQLGQIQVIDNPESIDDFLKNRALVFFINMLEEYEVTRDLEVIQKAAKERLAADLAVKKK